MAVSTSITHDRGLVGTPQVGADVDVYETHSTPRFAIGTGFPRSDGAVFRYSHFGAACKQGLVVSQDFSESGTTQIDSRVIAVSSTTAVSGETISPNSIGAYYVQISLGGITADQFAGGYLCISNGTGSGYTYRIQGNTVSGSPATGQIYIRLWKPLAATLDATSDISIAGNRWANLESATSATDPLVAGVVVGAVTDISDKPYGWVQTKGIIGVLTDASVPSKGDPVMLSRVTTGNCSQAHQLAGNNLDLEDPLIGICWDPGASGENSIIDLNI